VSSRSHGVFRFPEVPLAPLEAPLVSIVVPMYNAETVIGQQLDALLAQGYEGEWEIVVADNGSTDGGADVVATCVDRDPRVRLVNASSAKGASHARNVGSRAARGDVILYADADDVVAPGWIHALVDALRLDGFVAGQQREFRPDAPASVIHDDDGWTQLPRSFDFLPWAFGGNCGLRRTAYERVGGWREDYTHGGDDVDFCWRVQLAGFPLVFVREAVVFYRGRSTLTELARQQFEFGARAPMLYREFKVHGAKRRGVRQVLRNWLWVVTRSPYLVLGNERRRRWVATTAGGFGRVWGSIRWRQLCL
jgi:GT2 family glycosyltransferase